MWFGVIAAAAAQVAEPLATPFSALTGPLWSTCRRWRGRRRARRCPWSRSRLRPPRSPPSAPRSRRGRGHRDGHRRRIRAGSRRHHAHAGTHEASRRRVRAATAGLLTVAGGVAGDATVPAPPARRPARPFLDIGQGDATLIELDGRRCSSIPGARRADPRAPRGGRGRPTGRADAHARRVRPRGGRAAGDRTHRPRLIVDGGAGWDSPTQRALGRAPGRARADARARARRSPSGG